MLRADAHIHLFERGFQGRSLVSRPGVAVDELALYESMRHEHGVQAALTVGYAGATWCLRNNDYLASLMPVHPWIHATAFVPLTGPETEPPDVGRLAQQGFVGLSFYLQGREDTAALHTLPDQLWQETTARRMLISVNACGDAWRSWRPILDQHPELRILISHLGLPPRQRHAPEHPEQLLDSVLDLASYSGPRVKLSGLYALSDPGHDYPHRSTWPYVRAFRDAFTDDRLLWGSDFSPFSTGSLSRRRSTPCRCSHAWIRQRSRVKTCCACSGPCSRDELGSS